MFLRFSGNKKSLNKIVQAFQQVLRIGENKPQ